MSELKWIKHDGGPMPVDGNAVVYVRCRDGWDTEVGGWHGKTAGYFKENVNWWETVGSDQIVEYAVTVAGVLPGDQDDAYGNPQSAIDSHYTKYAIEPLEFSIQNELDAAQHTVIKYVTRFRDKHGKRDLLAARNVIDWLIKREYSDEQA